LKASTTIQNELIFWGRLSAGVGALREGFAHGLTDG